MSSLSMIALKRRAKMLVAGVTLSAAAFAMLPGMATANPLTGINQQATNQFSQGANLVSAQSNEQTQNTTQVSGVNAAVSAPITAGALNSGDQNVNSGANAGNFSSQEQWAANTTDQSVYQRQQGTIEQQATKSYSKKGSCYSTCSGGSGGSTDQQATNQFSQGANLVSAQSNEQTQNTTQVSGVNAAVSAPITAGALNSGDQNVNSGANAGNFSSQEQWAANTTDQSVYQRQQGTIEQEAGSSYSRKHSYSKDNHSKKSSYSEKDSCGNTCSGGSADQEASQEFSQEADLSSEQSNEQTQNTTQVSLVNAAVSAPITVGLLNSGDQNVDSEANAGNFSSQEQDASNEADQSIEQNQEGDIEQEAGKSYSEEDSCYKEDSCDNTCSSSGSGGSSDQEASNEFSQEASQSSEQSNTQEQNTTQVSGVNAAVSAPITVGLLNSGDQNVDSEANAGNFSSQEQDASNEADQSIEQNQEGVIGQIA